MFIQIEPELFKASDGKLCLASISATVTWREEHPELWKLLQQQLQEVQNRFAIEDVAKIPQIVGLRETYKKLGKKPQKYRGSNEALLRRVLKGSGLYQVSNLVDINNLISLQTMRSVGSYDQDRLNPPVSFGIGKPDEPYEGIGRGQLNIANMPVFRDRTGPFGSATSDSERTKVTAQTRRLLTIIIGFDGEDGLREQAEFAGELLTRFADGRDLQIDVHHCPQ